MQQTFNDPPLFERVKNNLYSDLVYKNNRLAIRNQEYPWVSGASIVHFGVGFFVGLLGVSLIWWILLHLTWELLENSLIGQRLSQGFQAWSNYKLDGCTKPPTLFIYCGDSAVNSNMDTICAIAGWFIGYLVRTANNPSPTKWSFMSFWQQ